MTIRTLPAPNSILQTKSKPEDVEVRFRVVHSIKTILPASLAFKERVIRGNYNGVVADVNERNFPLDAMTASLTTNLKIDVVFVVADMDMERSLNNANLLKGIQETEFQAATVGVHLEASNLYSAQARDVSVFSLDAIANNWRGADSQRSVLTTSNNGGSSELTNFLMTDTRSWRKESLFLLFRQP